MSTYFKCFSRRILLHDVYNCDHHEASLLQFLAKIFANCKQTTAIVLEIVAWILFANQRFFPKPFVNSKSLVCHQNSFAWKVGSWLKLQSITQQLSNCLGPNPMCDNEKFQHCQGQVTFLLLSILTWVLRKHQDDFNRSQTQFLLFADQLNWLGKWNTRATDTCLLSLERVTLLVSKCLWTENTCLQFISAAEQFKLLRFYQCPGHHVLSIN